MTPPEPRDDARNDGRPAEGGVAIVLLSGGLDSATTLAVARARGHACRCLAFDYAQRHRHELAAARRVAAAVGCPLTVFPLDLGAFGGSALTADLAVPKDRSEGVMTDIPVTYVPARNLAFLAIALGLGEVVGARDLYVGVNALDYSGYPDCRPAFVESFERTANLATKAGVTGDPFRVHAPLIDLTKAEIIRLGVDLGVDYALTHSCYDPAPDGGACGRCDSCVIRRRGFEEAGVADPTRYAPRAEQA